MVHPERMLIQLMQCHPVLWEKQGEDFTNFWKILSVSLEVEMQNQKHNYAPQDQLQQHVHRIFSRYFPKLKEESLTLGILI